MAVLAVQLHAEAMSRLEVRDLGNHSVIARVRRRPIRSPADRRPRRRLIAHQRSAPATASCRRLTFCRPALTARRTGRPRGSNGPRVLCPLTRARSPRNLAVPRAPVWGGSGGGSVVQLDSQTLRTYVRGVGLMWTDSDGYIRKGYDADGRFVAHVSRLTGVWTVYVAPWGCGLDNGLTFGAFETDDEAMDAANRYVVAHLDSA